MKERIYVQYYKSETSFFSENNVISLFYFKLLFDSFRELHIAQNFAYDPKKFFFKFGMGV